ncbi:tRNA pseudouridine synthase D, putative (macronuclear) [Tetrahymena thermophila SB210]|uniref:tRNA pseudouridine synthase D, putative n=1 Tax=Tetrahymena thermophila (strain SB210) TaxID=312017 RepID=W7XH30_TETTS|nr:tRNA pseudouridine synthase D, putative [Tetrahymena thermophila SB210]EWS76433.1 tRNA pseudouridine synthase D, putative [Tetrahymena thermophila SB210]|eukprot:XP_012651057.1 tRNA pseudouridine synthase D, putative [Tetrahymena thermophila SB210]
MESTCFLQNSDNRQLACQWDIVAKKRENFLIDGEAEGDDENGQEEEESKYQSIGDYEIEVIDDPNIDKYTLYDVLIPIIGGKLKVPENFNLNAYLISILEKDGLDQQLFEQVQKKFYVEGGYRFLICQAEDVQYSRLINTIKKTRHSYSLLQPLARLIRRKRQIQCRELTKISSDFDTQMGLNKEYQHLE